MQNLTKKIIAGITTIACAAWMVGIPMTAGAMTADELQDQINVLMEQLAALQTQLGEIEGETPAPAGVVYDGIPAGFTFENNLKYGMTNDEVQYLQIILKAEIGAPTYPDTVAATGYFGSITLASAKAFQEKYAGEILTPLGLSSGTGYVGSSTRTKLNSLLGL